MEASLRMFIGKMCIIPWYSYIKNKDQKKMLHLGDGMMDRFPIF